MRGSPADEVSPNGSIALVDEATGYQRIREERSLATILEKFIAKELQPWTRTFPYTFYEQIFRLKGGQAAHRAFGNGLDWDTGLIQAFTKGHRYDKKSSAVFLPARMVVLASTIIPLFMRDQAHRLPDHPTVPWDVASEPRIEARP